MIETVALALSPFSASHLLALIQCEEPFQKEFGLPAADGLRAFFVSGDVSPDWLARLNAAPLAPPDPWSHGFAVVHRDSQLVIGSVGFREPPDAAGVVEIGYGIVADYEGRGYATEAVQAIISCAFDSGQVTPVTLVRAHTLPVNEASTRVLAKCGFTRIGEVVDPEDGLVWRWERGKDHNRDST